MYIHKFLGDSCERDIRACSAKPCQNNGSCSEVIRPGQAADAVNSFLCNCSSSFFSGLRCEIKFNVCWNKTCSYNGKCFNNASNSFNFILNFF